MDYLIRKILTETEYAAQSATLGPYDGVIVVADYDPKIVIKLAIGSQTFVPSSAGAAPSTATYLTNTTQTTDLPNSVSLGDTNLNVGTQAILMNNPSVFGEATIVGNVLQNNDSGFLWVDNAGALSQTRTLDFQTTSGKQNLTINNIDVLTFDATAYSLNGNTVASDTAFYAPIIYGATFSNIVGSDITFTPYSQPALTVTYDTATTVTIQKDLFLTGLTATSGTALILDGSNQVRLLTSSERFKEDIRTVCVFDPTIKERFKALRPVTFRYKYADEKSNDPEISIGLIAEEVVKLFPETVNLDKEKLPFSISYDQISVITVAVVQNLLKEINLLKDEVSKLTLKSIFDLSLLEIELLKKRLDTLESAGKIS
jgi:hypothetical protein